MSEQPFAKMRGLDLLIVIRDELLDERNRKKDFIQSCEKVAGGVTPDKDRQRVAMLEAAADAFTYVIGVGQHELIECKGDSRRRFPDWITRFANQARVALIADEVDPEDQPAG